VLITADNATVQNVVFSHGGGRTDATKAVSITGARTGLTVSGNTFTLVGTRGVADNEYTATGTITRNTFYLSGAALVTAVSSSYGTWAVTYNTISGSDITTTNPYSNFIDVGASSVIQYNDISAAASCLAAYGVSAWSQDGITVQYNRFVWAAEKGRIVTPDNNSSGWTISDNTWQITSNAANDPVAGIRYRGTESPAACGGGHIIEYNTIDASGSSGMVYPLYLGDDAGEPNCAGVRVRYNQIMAGDYAAIHFYGNDQSATGYVTDNDFYCNIISSEAYTPIDVSSSGVPTDIHISNNSITSGSGYTVATGGRDLSAYVYFCGNGTVTPASGAVGADSPCQDGAANCYSAAGTRYSGPWGASSPPPTTTTRRATGGGTIAGSLH
jgi:hypothetical protein